MPVGGGGEQPDAPGDEADHQEGGDRLLEFLAVGSRTLLAEAERLGQVRFRRTGSGIDDSQIVHEPGQFPERTSLQEGPDPLVVLLAGEPAVGEGIGENGAHHLPIGIGGADACIVGLSRVETEPGPETVHTTSLDAKPDTVCRSACIRVTRAGYLLV